MEIMKKYKALLVLALVVVGGFLFFYRMYHHDVKTLENFSASYKKFDKAIADFSTSETGDSEAKTGNSLTELNQNSLVQISSLIKNDGLLMNTELEIADLSQKELDALKAYKRAIQSKDSNSDGLAKEYSNLTGKRKAAYVRFQGLGGIKG